MFETSVIHQSQATTRRVSLLTISVIAHSAVVIGAVAVSIASVKFPTWAPKETSSFIVPVFTPPPPLGNPNGGAVRQPEPQRPATPPPAQPNQITAPSIVPDKIVEASTTPSDTPNIGAGQYNGPAIPGATSTEPPGVPDGDPNSVFTTTNNVVTPAPPEKIYEAHEVKSPVALYRPAPPYPPLMLKSRMPATVVVRCIIDRNGHVRDPQITLPARMAPFNEAVLEAVQKWRFTPGSLNGQAVETYLSLTVHFSVN